MTPAGISAATLADLHQVILEWYADNARDLPWRRSECSPWGVFVSEIMAQQTPLARVEPAWRDWMARWPTPGDLAAASPGEAVRAWARLGYPRRALRLHEAAAAIVARHGGQVPASYDDLLALPGVGPYTAAAVAAFAFGIRTTVVDTNVRRVQARLITGVQPGAPSLTRAEAELAAALVPREASAAATWNVAVMELGALVCTARTPQCPSCPVADRCAWRLAGSPAYEGPPRRRQPFTGTDREIRGRLLSVLRDHHGPVSAARLADAWPSEPERRDRCLDSLVADGLVEPMSRKRFRLPS